MDGWISLWAGGGFRTVRWSEGLMGWVGDLWLGLGLMGFVTRKEDLQGSCGDASARFLVEEDEEDIFIVKLLALSHEEDNRGKGSRAMKDMDRWKSFDAL